MQYDDIDNISNNCEKDTNPDEKIITVNKSKFIDDISTLIGVVFIFGVGIGATIMRLIIHFSR